MRQLQTNDQRVNELLGGLEKIVNSIASMRNTDSDAHGVGQNRININGREARLIMNCSMAFCEYLVTGKKINNSLTEYSGLRIPSFRRMIPFVRNSVLI